MDAINSEYVEGLWERQLKIDRAKAMIAWFLPWLASQLDYVIQKERRAGGYVTSTDEMAVKGIIEYGPINNSVWIVSHYSRGHMNIDLCYADGTVGCQAIRGRFNLLNLHNLTIPELFAVQARLPEIVEVLVEKFPGLREQLDTVLLPHILS